jgi:peptidoglycan/xylan/chitin deacetylase (PgdA/CDA1 family)
VCGILEIDVAAWSRKHRPYMTRTQLAQLHADGFTLGGHTVDHPRLARLDSASSRRRQIVESCRWVAELTGRDRVPFAFPFNGADVDCDELSDVREESGVIDLIYDTNDLMKDRDFIVNRIWGDTPVGGDAVNSNLPGLLRRAYLFEPVRGMKRRLRSLRT